MMSKAAVEQKTTEVVKGRDIPRLTVGPAVVMASYCQVRSLQANYLDTGISSGPNTCPLSLVSRSARWAEGRAFSLQKIQVGMLTVTETNAGILLECWYLRVLVTKHCHLRHILTQ